MSCQRLGLNISLVLPLVYYVTHLLLLLGKTVGYSHIISNQCALDRNDTPEIMRDASKNKILGLGWLLSEDRVQLSS